MVAALQQNHVTVSKVLQQARQSFASSQLALSQSGEAYLDEFDI
jgi:hypothetical protein